MKADSGYGRSGPKGPPRPSFDFISALTVFFIGGILMLIQVDEREDIRVAEEENRPAGLA